MRIMTNKEQTEALRLKAQELSHRITGGDAEAMQMMDECYDTIRLLEYHGEYKSLIDINGSDLPIVKDYIDDTCVILITDKIRKLASDNMRSD